MATWRLVDSYPVFMNMEPESPAQPWDVWWYGGPMFMVFPEEQVADAPITRMILTTGFMGPRE